MKTNVINSCHLVGVLKDPSEGAEALKPEHLLLLAFGD